MKNPFAKESRVERNMRFDRMFETRSEAWERVGLAINVSQQAIRKARRRGAIYLTLFVAVIVVHDHYQSWFLTRHTRGDYHTPITVATVLIVLVLGWAAARDVGRAAAPTFFRRMDPATAGTVGFVIRLATVLVTLIWALHIAGASASSLVAGSAFTAIVVGLAAQQTLGNVFAGMVLLSARPFRVGERIRLQAGAAGGAVEGIVSSLGLLYTTLTRGEDRTMIPNNLVLAAVIIPLREPNPVDVKVRLGAGIRPSHVQAILDDQVSIPTRTEPRVLLEEIDGDEVVVRVQATPERSADGGQLADQIIAALATVTGEHAVTRE